MPEPFLVRSRAIHGCAARFAGQHWSRVDEKEVRAMANASRTFKNFRGTTVDCAWVDGRMPPMPAEVRSYVKVKICLRPFGHSGPHRTTIYRAMGKVKAHAHA